MRDDIVTCLRQTRANMLGTDDEPHYWDCHDAATEIERLRRLTRLSREELEALEFFATLKWPRNSLNCRARSITIRDLLARWRDNDTLAATGSKTLMAYFQNLFRAIFNA